MSIPSAIDDGNLRNFTQLWQNETDRCILKLELKKERDHVKQDK